MNSASALRFFYQGYNPTNEFMLPGMVSTTAMDTSFSMDLSFSSDLLEHPSYMQSPNFRNAVVLSWEHVLFPAKWMSEQLGLRPTVKALQDTKAKVFSTPYLQQTLALIEHRILQLLTSVSESVPVYVICEQSVTYVEALCTALFPRLAYCLQSSTVLTHVQILGAPKKFGVVSEKVQWRILLLQSIVQERLYGGAPHLLLDREIGRFGFMVVSPHSVDTTLGATKVRDVAPYVVSKSIKVLNTRTMALDQFPQYLQALENYIMQAIQHESSFSTQFSL